MTKKLTTEGIAHGHGKGFELPQGKYLAAIIAAAIIMFVAIGYFGTVTPTQTSQPLPTPIPTAVPTAIVTGTATPTPEGKEKGVVALTLPDGNSITASGGAIKKIFPQEGREETKQEIGEALVTSGNRAYRVEILVKKEDLKNIAFTIAGVRVYNFTLTTYISNQGEITFDVSSSKHYMTSLHLYQYTDVPTATVNRHFMDKAFRGSVISKNCKGGEGNDCKVRQLFGEAEQTKYFLVYVDIDLN